MANLVISAICNRTCAYCFTRDHYEDNGGGAVFLDLDGFEARLDFLDRSGIDQARLIGGEPTLHPDFPLLVERARARGKTVIVFSNGLMPEPALACLEALPGDACSVLVNVNAPEDMGASTFQQLCATLRRLGQKATPGLNIYRVDLELAFLLNLVGETGCRPVIRLGLAHPCLSGSNRFVRPHQYVAIGRRIVHFARRAAGAGIRVEFDCGFVPCMFSPPDLEALRALGASAAWKCNPILDIDLEGRAIYCFPLSRLGYLPLTPQANAEKLRRSFEARVQPYRRAGVFVECSTCPLKRSGECPGGCLSATVRRFRHTPFCVTISDQELQGEHLGHSLH